MSAGTNSGLGNAPQSSPGTWFVDAVSCIHVAAALQSDGDVITWGNTGGSLWVPVPPLPPGVVYVEIAGDGGYVLARRSDGEVVAFGRIGNFQNLVPPLAPQTSYVEVDASWIAIGRVGPTSTYVTFAPGCAGTLRTSRLIPRDTPRIGATLEVQMLDLPTGQAMMVFGWTNGAPLPIALDPWGLPGCQLHVSLDAATLWSGSNQTAQFRLPIPDVPSLIGLRFYNQTIVFDPNANAAGAVMSDAAVGVVGNL